jgi:hypothetical protein
MENVLRSISGLGDARLSFLEALHGFWASTIDLIQRQEHGAMKEGKPLTWEDGRRVVFSTLIAMYELDRAVWEHRTR